MTDEWGVILLAIAESGIPFEAIGPFGSLEAAREFAEAGESQWIAMVLLPPSAVVRGQRLGYPCDTMISDQPRGGTR